MKSYRCPLCGFKFSANEMQKGACAKCPLNRNCHLTCCPHCNYQFVTESKTVNLIKNRFSKIVKKGEDDEQRPTKKSQ